VILAGSHLLVYILFHYVYLVLTQRQHYIT